MLYYCMNNTKTTTSDLIKNFQNGDQFAFNELIQRYGSDVFSFIFRMVKNRTTAEDIYQETWYRVLHHLKDYNEQNQFKSWIFRIANNLCLNQLRIFRRILVPVSDFFDNKQNSFCFQLVDETPLPDYEIENKEKSELIQKSVQLLPIKQRQVYLLRMHSDLSFKEIADLLDRPLNTVLTQLRTATLRLKDHLQEMYGEV